MAERILAVDFGAKRDVHFTGQIVFSPAAKSRREDGVSPMVKIRNETL